MKNAIAFVGKHSSPLIDVVMNAAEITASTIDLATDTVDWIGMGWRNRTKMNKVFTKYAEEVINSMKQVETKVHDLRLEMMGKNLSVEEYELFEQRLECFYAFQKTRLSELEDMKHYKG